VNLRPGEVVDGKYRIERKLAEGGMGAVFMARHLELGEPVALKVMLPEVAENASAAARFQREARAAGRLRGEHVVRVLDAGRFSDGSPYIVFEFIDGPDLRHIVKERGKRPVKEAVELILQACTGVAEAHALGMVHRDLALKNMSLAQRPDGSPLLKILDFGVVKVRKRAEEGETAVTGATGGTLTATNAIVGTGPYLAPEQIHLGSEVDARADVWALGVCLYELIADERPFAADTLAGLLLAITARPPRPLRELVPDVPDAVVAAIDRALEKNLGRRFQDVGELAGALGPIVGDTNAGERVGAILRASSSRTGPPKATAVKATDAPTRDWGPKAAVEPRDDVDTLTEPNAPSLDSAVTVALVDPALAATRPDEDVPRISALPVSAPPASPAPFMPATGRARGSAPPPPPAPRVPFAWIAAGAAIALGLVLFGIWSLSAGDPGRGEAAKPTASSEPAPTPSATSTDEPAPSIAITAGDPSSAPGAKSAPAARPHPKTPPPPGPRPKASATKDPYDTF
jgi:serine/threonine-protein kinase